jgi:cobalt-zinc-cadmium resistance protein CzcA
MRFKMKKQHIISLMFYCLPLGLWAQSLPECIDLALQNNLLLKSDRLSVEKAKDMQGTAFNIGKTNFAMSQDPTAGGSPDNSLSVSQSFEFPTVYYTRRN